MEQLGYTARYPDLRHLESVADSGRAGHDPDGERVVRALLRRCRRAALVSLRRRPLMATFPLALAALGLSRGAAAAATVDPGALAHCAAIVAADERLACYDSLARPKPSPAAAANPAPASATSSPHAVTAPGTPPKAAPATTAPATANAAPAAASAAPAAASAAPAAAAAGIGAGAAADSAKSFGLTEHPAPSNEGPDHIQAQVTRVD